MTTDREIGPRPRYSEGLMTDRTRPETGPMQFGDDWPGVFIRGDGALAAVLSLQRALKRLPADFGTMDLVVLQDLLQTLGSCRSDGAPGQPCQQATLQAAEGR